MAEATDRNQRRRLPWYARCVLYAVVLYILYCGLLFFVQHRLIFPASAAGEASPRPFHEAAEVIEIETEQGTTVGWFIPVPAPGSADGAAAGSRGPDDSPRPLVVFLHGNAELIDHQHDIVRMYHDLGVSVLLPEYRGYGDSDGSPSQAHIVADVVAMVDRVVARPEIDGERVVFHGRSIGGAVGAQVADQRPCAALIVESTGTSVAGMAWRYGVPPFLVRSPFDTERVFRGLDVPVLIMHGRDDAIFRYHHAEALLGAAPNAVLVPFDAGHNLPKSHEVDRYEEAVAHHLAVVGVVAAAEADEAPDQAPVEVEHP